MEIRLWRDSAVCLLYTSLANEAPKTVQDVLRGTPGLNIGYNADAKGGGTMMERGQRSVYVTDKNNPANLKVLFIIHLKPFINL